MWRLQAQVAGEDEGGDQDDDDEHHGGHRAHRLQLRHVVDTHLDTTQKILFTGQKIFAEQTLALTWWSTLMLTTLASRKPRTTAAVSELLRNSSPVMKVECALRTRLTRVRLNEV